MIDSRPTTAIVQQAEETERQLVERAIAAMNDPHWTVGECADLWTERYSRDRGVEAFGELIGMTGQQVARCRSVHNSFADVRGDYPGLSWSHFYTAMSWSDSAECLAWASENGASIKEMIAWRRMNGGDDEPNDHFEETENIAHAGEIDDEIQTTGQAAGFEDAEHAGEADPYQKPPSTVVDTPRDFEAEPDKPAEPVARTEMRDVLTAIRTAVKLVRGDSERREVAAELRRMADEIEGAV